MKIAHGKDFAKQAEILRISLATRYSVMGKVGIGRTSTMSIATGYALAKSFKISNT